MDSLAAIRGVNINTLLLYLFVLKNTFSGNADSQTVTPKSD
jgi:hypothetical protein